MTLSIITPYYDALDYIQKLATILIPQLNENVEWIIVDDGCHENELDKLKAKVIHLEQNSGGASKPRNIGLDNAQGKYIAFIDADDLVMTNYVQEILKMIENDYDYFYIGWCSNAFKVLIDDEPPFWNCCVWNCVYKKDLIGNERFNENLVIGEDYNFNIRVRKGSHSSIKDYLYFYNDTPNSLIKRGHNND